MRIICITTRIRVFVASTVCDKIADGNANANANHYHFDSQVRTVRIGGGVGLFHVEQIE